jgi:hypothetical protein
MSTETEQELRRAERALELANKQFERITTLLLGNRPLQDVMDSARRSRVRPTFS